MNDQTNQIWETLIEKNIVHGYQPEKEVIISPWYLKFIMAFSDWLAAIFILFL